MPRGNICRRYLQELAVELVRERDTAAAESSAPRGNIEHINEIVAMQQSYAGRGGVVETVEIRVLVEDSLRMNEELSAVMVVLIRDSRGRTADPGRQAQSVTDPGKCDSQRQVRLRRSAGRREVCDRPGSRSERFCADLRH